jgi:hypothetical protein
VNRAPQKPAPISKDAFDSVLRGMLQAPPLPLSKIVKKRTAAKRKARKAR